MRVRIEHVALACDVTLSRLSIVCSTHNSKLYPEYFPLNVVREQKRKKIYPTFMVNIFSFSLSSLVSAYSLGPDLGSDRMLKRSGFAWQVLVLFGVLLMKSSHFMWLTDPLYRILHLISIWMMIADVLEAVNGL